MSKSFSLFDGFMIGGGIIVAGLLLQFTSGGVVWDALAWPANAIVLAVFIAIIIAIYLTPCVFWEPTKQLFRQ